MLLLLLPNEFARNRTQDMASHKISSVFVTLTSVSKVKVIECVFLDRLSVNRLISLKMALNAQHVAARQGLIRFRDIELAVKQRSMSQKVFFETACHTKCVVLCLLPSVSLAGLVWFGLIRPIQGKQDG